MDRKQLDSIAFLARLSFVDKDIESRVHVAVDDIIRWADSLQAVDTDGIAPLFSVFDDHAVAYRADIVKDGQCLDSLLQNAPSTEDGFFTVPKMRE